MKIVTQTLFLLIAVAAAYLFAPAGIGGRITYTATSGTSMAPNFKTGDLAVLRKSGPVHIGDIAGYRSGLTGQIVVHRVIADKDGHLTFKGDNNWWIDTYRPTQQEVIGKLWIHLGGAGKKVNAINPSWVLGGIGLVGIMTVASTGKKTSVRGRSRKVGAPSGTFGSQGAQILLAALLLVAFISSVLAFVAFRSDTTTTTNRIVTAEQTGDFRYEGAAVPGPVYEENRLKTGDPIYVDLVPTITTSFSYHLQAPTAKDIHGTVRLFAVTRDINGWERSSDLIPATPFDGPDASVSTEVDLSGLMLLAAALQQVTGATSRYWTTAISAEVLLTGTMDGQPFESRFAPFYTLRVTPPNEIFVETALTRDFESAPPEPGNTAGANSFFPHDDLTVSVPEVVPATLSLVVTHVRVDYLRRMASILAIASFLLALGVGGAMAWALRTRAARFYARYGNRLVRVAGMSPPANAVQMETMEDLVRVADRYQSVILWIHHDDDDMYAVQDVSSTFVFRPER
ncbi:MAG: hypothetical protein ABI577_16085 [bacterium]